MAKWVNGIVAHHLRKQGYVPLPRMWVLKEDMPKIMEICHQYENHVKAVRAYYRDMKRKEEAENALQEKQGVPGAGEGREAGDFEAAADGEASD